MKRHLFALLAAASLPVFAGPPIVQPQSQTWLSDNIEVELRLKTATESTAKVYIARFRKLEDAGRFIVKVPCWNKVSVCPPVASVTIKVFLKVPWIGRANVTRFTLCSQSECSLPAFAALQAKPGEAYRFFYNRMTAAWEEAPSVVALNLDPTQ